MSSSDLLSLCATPSLSLSVFRVNPKPAAPNQPALPEAVLNDLNKLFYGRISCRKDIILTQTVLNGQFCIRFAIGSARTQEVHIRDAFELITQEAKLACEAWAQPRIGAWLRTRNLGHMAWVEHHIDIRGGPMGWTPLLCAVVRITEISKQAYINVDLFPTPL